MFRVRFIWSESWRTDPGGWFKIKMSSYLYRKSHCGDKTVARSAYLHNGISYTGKMTSLNWIRDQLFQFNSSSAFVKFTGKRIIYVVSYVVDDDEVSVTDTWAVCSKHVQANINEITIDILHLSFVKGMQRWPTDFRHKGSILPEALPRYDIIFRLTTVPHVLDNIPAWHSRKYHGL